MPLPSGHQANPGNHFPIERLQPSADSLESSTKAVNARRDNALFFHYSHHLFPTFPLDSVNCGHGGGCFVHLTQVDHLLRFVGTSRVGALQRTRQEASARLHFSLLNKRIVLIMQLPCGVCRTTHAESLHHDRGKSWRPAFSNTWYSHPFLYFFTA